jgi:shikimate kinase
MKIADQRPKSIFLTGLKHSGKSTLAERLAPVLKVKYMDLDDLVEREYRSDKLLSCREIYRQHGRDFFLELEASAAAVLAKKMKFTFAVASLGGGTIENRPAMERLKTAGLFVYIEHDIEVLFRRIMKHGRPPFFSEEDPHKDFLDIVERRVPLLKERADIIITLKDGTVDESLAAVTARLKEYGYAW